MTDRLAVVGLWHLGCSITASWVRLGHAVTAVDFDEALVAKLCRGHAPIFEPGLDEALAAGLRDRRLALTAAPSGVSGARFVFLAYDTPVRDDDTSDLSVLWHAVDRCAPHLDRGAIVIVSAQLPVGTARDMRARLKSVEPSLELVYSPENLRLGDAIRCYLEPGHVVIGAEDRAAGDAVEELFAPMGARCCRMNLPSAEMAKHCINSFLATSVTLANQWADLCAASGGDFADVAEVLRLDPRIGQRAYISPGIGFSGGTLGRDLRVLDEGSRTLLEGRAPLFGAVWRYNQERVGVVARRAAALLGGLDGRRVALLGMTYKPGTSTLRRSLPLAVARDLLGRHAVVRAHDPKADWSETDLPGGLAIAESPYDVARDADLVVLLTEWPEYRDLDYARLAAGMRRRLLLDTKGFLRAREREIAAAGLTMSSLGRGAEGSP